MEFKRIIVLANSIKKAARCIAGRDVGLGRDLMTGKWIRPVSGESEGELEARHMKTERGTPLKVLQIMDVPLTKYANDPIHPEDWVVDTKRLWKKAADLESKTLEAFEEWPKDLWLESTAHTDRVTGSFLSTRFNHQSLYLIRPADLSIESSCENNKFKGKTQKKTRVKFTYCGQKYQMSLTDPVFTDRHCKSHPPLGAPASIVRPP